ncbi:hypothetical protein SELMODRAFT_421680 [Selaginella moellendorffii]|uniref:Uncharacterized protein n=1 Tax=Selaginella moellendorffii TaxID=88036 RepID=D8SG12_SELML|nr:hypothetical protein SELMODRAFT_421680 [Selaginella moellendorffii]
MKLIASPRTLKATEIRVEAFAAVGAVCTVLSNQDNVCMGSGRDHEKKLKKPEVELLHNLAPLRDRKREVFNGEEHLQYFALDNGLEGVTKLEVDDPRYTFTGDFKVNDVLEMIKKKKKCICVESIQEIAEPDKDKHDSCCCCSSCC